MGVRSVSLNTNVGPGLFVGVQGLGSLGPWFNQLGGTRTYTGLESLSDHSGGDRCNVKVTVFGESGPVTL